MQPFQSKRDVLPQNKRSLYANRADVSTVTSVLTPICVLGTAISPGEPAPSFAPQGPVPAATSCPSGRKSSISSNWLNSPSTSEPLDSPPHLGFEDITLETVDLRLFWMVGCWNTPLRRIVNKGRRLGMHAHITATCGSVEDQTPKLTLPPAGCC